MDINHCSLTFSGIEIVNAVWNSRGAVGSQPLQNTTFILGQDDTGAKVNFLGTDLSGQDGGTTRKGLRPSLANP